MEMKFEKHYIEVALTTSNYFNSCWTKINPIAPTIRALTEDPDFCYSDEVAITTGLFLTLEFIAGSILNFLVILAVLRSKDIRKEYLTPSILSIAITDFIFSAYVIPVSAIKFFSRDMPFPAVCEFTAFTAHSLWLLSALNLLGISVMRCFVVFFPWNITNKKFKYACRIWPVLSWIISFLAMLKPLLGKYGRFGLECRSFLCKLIDVDFNGNTTHFDPMKMYFIFVISSGIIMLLLTIVAFFRVSYYSKSMFNQMKDINMDIAKQMLNKEKSFGKMMAIVSASFIIVYFPIFILMSMDEHAAARKEKAMLVAIVLTASLVIIDPLAYIFCHKQYRTEIKIMLRPIMSIIR